MIVSDLCEHLPLLKKNAEKNKSHFKDNLEVKEIRWGRQEDAKDLNPDLVLVSDCVYYEDSVDPLIDTFLTLRAPILMTFEERQTEHKQKVQRQFFDTLEQKGFQVRFFGLDDCHPDYASPDIKVVEIKQKDELNQN